MYIYFVYKISQKEFFIYLSELLQFNMKCLVNEIYKIEILSIQNIITIK
jgi:hypothetical protein